ncbi:CBS domain-containing protein [uncultured Rhodospira sp.]|uniref:CBS domain-containing protein n=1 Tax=uncultured Rhodospira sp. TaxID=1936189 RepID=UPI0026349EE9|nr:CBS domain-containing protein [uncultured Rhodospira sp.]
MTIQDIMTPSVDVVDPTMTIRDAAIRMRDEDVGGLPVGENDRLVGMVTDRDITVRGVAGSKGPGDCTVRDVLSERVYYCFEDEDAQRAADVMAEHKVRRLPVLNRDKRLVGIVAVADLVRAGVEHSAIEGISVPTRENRA